VSPSTRQAREGSTRDENFTNLVIRMANCLFCQLAAAPGDRHVLTSDIASAFLDKSPLFQGHVLVVPRAHAETLLDLPDEGVGPFFGVVKRVARAVEEAMGAKGTFVAMNNKVSQSVPHLHVHVVPRSPKDGLRGFFWPRTKYPSDEVAVLVAKKIRDALAST
jgi:histidine triad (HIT) family protein